MSFDQNPDAEGKVASEDLRARRKGVRCVTEGNEEMKFISYVGERSMALLPVGRRTHAAGHRYSPGQ